MIRRARGAEVAIGARRAINGGVQTRSAITVPIDLPAPTKNFQSSFSASFFWTALLKPNSKPTEIRATIGG